MKFSRIFIVVLIFLGLIVVASASFNFQDKIDPTADVAEIPIYGIIEPGSVFGSNEYLETTIEEANQENVDAFLFRINSPGGTVVHSKQMRNIVNNIRQPAVCLLEDIALSGAYWVASACDHIVSDSLTLTGSIGVSSAYLEYSEHMQEEGIGYVDLVEGEKKDMGTPYRNITEEERDILTGQLEIIKDEFLGDIIENRDFDNETIDEIGSSRTYLGQEALERNLVDTLGNKNDVRQILENTLESEVEFTTYGTDVDILDILGVSEEDKIEERENLEAHYDLLMSTLSNEQTPIAKK